LDEASAPVTITFWHAMTSANEDALVDLTSEFNETQDDVKVELVNQTSYTDVFTKYRAGLGSGELPDLAQIEDTGLQVMIDSQSVLPAQTCIDATGYDLSDHVGRVVGYYTVDDVLWPMPFNVSNPVLYYDRAVFEAAGLDPDDPPATLDEVRAASDQIVRARAAKTGMAIKLDPWVLEQMVAIGGELYVDGGNGRRQRATEAVFDSAAGIEVFSWIDGMVDSKLAQITDPGFGNLLAVGAGDAAMTIETSAALGTIKQVLAGGQYGDVELGVAPMPGPEGSGGVLVGGAALYIVNKSSAAEQEAAWRYVSFLNEPATQARWAASTGYVPIRESAATLPEMTSIWREEPGFKVAYDQLLAGERNDATAGPVIGDYAGVRQAVLEALQSMISEGTTPEDAIDAAKRAADEAIEEYNARIGEG
jgi:sn-glycerol 3-phosphate transport system substrate-binding protein